MKAVKKPVEVDVWQLNIQEIEDKSSDVPLWVWRAMAMDKLVKDGGDVWFVKTLEGVMATRERDYLIRGILGELYPCKRDAFELTYTIL